jgi:hypothetical protein
MNRLPLNNRIGLSLSSMCLALLTACGGGGDPAETVQTGALATPAAATTVCGLEPVAGTGPQSHTVTPDLTLLVHGYDALMTRLTSPNGYPAGGVPVGVRMAMEDLRAVTFTGYTATPTVNRMGVEVDSAMAPGSVACVLGVSRVNNNGSSLLVSWGSTAVPSLPVGQLPSQPVNGFEYIHNLANANATAVFTIAKAELAEPAGVSVCHISAGGIACSVPTVVDAGSQWTFRLAISQPGVYMMAAPAELVPLD